MSSWSMTTEQTPSPDEGYEIQLKLEKWLLSCHQFPHGTNASIRSDICRYFNKILLCFWPVRKTRPQNKR